MPGLARPVRMPAKSSLATSTAFSIFSSASKSVSSIILSRCFLGVSGRVPVCVRASHGGDERADPLTLQRARDVSFAFHAEHDHRQLVVVAEAERRLVHDPKPLLQ